MVLPAALAAIIISLLPVLSISLLAGAAAGILLIQRFYPDCHFLWRLAFICAAISWACILISGYGMPIFLQSPSPEGDVYVVTRPAFIIDGTSWPIAIALSTLLVAILVRDLGEIEQVAPLTWSGMLAITAIGLATTYAATPVTLMIGWAGIDLIESAVMLSQIGTAELRRQFILAVGFRTLSTCVLLWASAVYLAAEYDLTMLGYTPEMNVYLLAAAVLRLGIIPLHDPFFIKRELRRSLGTLTRITNAAAAMILICRLAGTNFPAALSPWLLIAGGMAAQLGALTWWKAADEIDGRPSWILTLAGLATAAALLALPLACIIWTLVLILAGSLLFVTERSNRRGRYLPLLGLALSIGLPFTPAWLGMEIFLLDSSTPWTESLARGLLMLAFIVALAGYFRYAMKINRDERENVSSYGFFMESVAALFALAIYIGLGVWFTLNSSGQPWLPGIIAGAGTVLLIILRKRMSKTPAAGALAALQAQTIPIDENALVPAGQVRPSNKFLEVIASMQAVVSLDWMYMFLFRFFDFFRHLFRMMTRILEGEGGLLWALLIFILLITFMFRSTGGS